MQHALAIPETTPVDLIRVFVEKLIKALELLSCDSEDQTRCGGLLEQRIARISISMQNAPINGVSRYTLERIDAGPCRYEKSRRVPAVSLGSPGND